MTTFVITGMVKYCWAQIKSQMIMRSVMYRQPGERLTFRQLESTSSSRPHDACRVKVFHPKKVLTKIPQLGSGADKVPIQVSCPK